MGLARICSECGKSLDGKSPRALTCSTACRQKRARRLRASNVDAGALRDTESVRDLVRASGADAVQAVMKEELRPVVREAIDQDVLEAIGKMVRLTTQAVQVLADDLEGEDRVMRQRAAALVVKYTVGHPALVKAPDEKPSNIEVHFSLPRPDGEAAVEVTEDGEVVETKICDDCGLEKAVDEFVAGSDRCAICFEEGKRKVREQFGL